MLLPIDYVVETDTLGPEPIMRPGGELVIVFFERRIVKAVGSTDGGATLAPPERLATLRFRVYSFRPGHLRHRRSPRLASIVRALCTPPGTTPVPPLLRWERHRCLTLPPRGRVEQADPDPAWAPRPKTDFILPAFAVDPRVKNRLTLAFTRSRAPTAPTRAAA